MHHGYFTSLPVVFLLFATLACLTNPARAQDDCDPYWDFDCYPEDEPAKDESAGGKATAQPQQAAAAPAGYPAYTGPKQTVAVLTFENKTKNVPKSWQLGEGLTEIFITELLRTNRYIVVERSALQQILREQELGQSGLMRPEGAPKTGGLAGAQFLIKGAVTEFRYAAEGSGFGIGIKGLNLESESKAAHVGIDVRLIDSHTGQIIASHRAKANADASGFKLGFTKNDLRLGTGQFKNTPLGVAARQAIANAIHFIIGESQNLGWSGSIIKVTGDQAYINRGANAGVSVGQRLIVFSKAGALIDPETGLNLGADEERIGELTITRVKEKYSIGRLQLFGGVNAKRGDAVKLPQ